MDCRALTKSLHEIDLKRHSRDDSRHSRKSNHNLKSSGGSASVSSSRHDSLEPTSTKPAFELYYMSQPSQALSAGTPFRPSVLMSARPSTSHKSHNDLPFGELIAVASLLTDAGSGRYAPSPLNMPRGQRPVDNLHQLPWEYQCRLPHDLRDAALGYFSFPDLTIGRAGIYRIRVSVVQVPDVRSRSQETQTLLSVDSAPFRVYGQDYDTTDSE